MTSIVAEDLQPLPTMGIRDFLRGGYQNVYQPVQITKFGRVIGVFTPAELEHGEEVANLRSRPESFYIKSRGR